MVKKGSSSLPPDHYRFVVETTRDPTYEELCAAYDWVSDDWKKGGETHELLSRVKSVPGEKVAFLAVFDHGMRDEEAIVWAMSRGYRVAFQWEREAFTKAHPVLSRDGIVDLGSGVRWRDRLIPAFLDRLSSGRRLTTMDAGGYPDGWGKGYRFLFVQSET